MEGEGKRESGASVVTMEAGVNERQICCLWWNSQEPEAKECWYLLEAGKGKQMDSPMKL